MSCVAHALTQEIVIALLRGEAVRWLVEGRVGQWPHARLVEFGAVSEALQVQGMLGMCHASREVPASVLTLIPEGE